MQEILVRSLGWEDPLEKGKATQLQCSGLENSMGCIDHGVTKSRTGLSGFHFQPSVVSVYDMFIHSSADEHLG